MVRLEELEARNAFLNKQISGVIEEARRKLGEGIKFNADGSIDLGEGRTLSNEPDDVITAMSEFTEKVRHFIEQGGQVPRE
jgi:hypothetical protein